MKEVTIQTKIKVFDNLLELDKESQLLIRKAKGALELSYAPYSRFKVGSSILLEDGTIILGSNQENAAYPMCLCAERTALATCNNNHPNLKIKKIAVTVQSPSHIVKTPASPCGACRQVLLEQEQRQESPIEVLLHGEEGPVYLLSSTKDLLPIHFDPSFL